MEDPGSHQGVKVLLYVAVWPCTQDQMLGADNEGEWDNDAWGCRKYDPTLGATTFVGHVTHDGNISGWSESWPDEDVDPELGLFVARPSGLEIVPGWIFKMRARLGPRMQVVEYFTDQNVDAPIFYVDGLEIFATGG